MLANLACALSASSWTSKRSTPLVGARVSARGRFFRKLPVMDR